MTDWRAGGEEVGSFPEVAVVGHAGRDLVLLADELPPSGGSVAARRRLEVPGGKGYNQALALTQLGHRTGLVAAVGDDAAGRWALECARRDGIEAAGVALRVGAPTALVVSLVQGDGSWRYVEDLPEATFASSGDISANRALFEAAAVTSLQMQEPPEVLLEAARVGRAQGRLVVGDGALSLGGPAEELLSMLDVLRCDEREAAFLVGNEVTDGREAIDAARAAQSRGPGLVIVAAGSDGNAVAWEGGAALVPLGDEKVVDSTGGGDALVAGLIDGLLSGCHPLMAACTGVAAAGHTVTRLGGRPGLHPAEVRSDAARLHRMATPFPGA